MVREVGEPGVGVDRRARVEQLGDRPVEPHALERDELGDEHLPHECVREAEATEHGRVLDDEPRLTGLGHGVDEVAAHDVLDQLDIEGRAHHRRDREGVVGRSRQAGEPPPRCLTNAFREAGRIPCPARLLDMAQHLDQEERVAPGDLGDRSRQCVIGVPDRVQVRLHLGCGETSERDAIRRRVAPQVGEGGGQRVRSSELGVAVRADHQ